MQLSTYQFHADRQKQIENYCYTKSILRNAGIVFISFSLIFLGITLMVDFDDLKLDFALLLCVFLTLACFVNANAINRKIRALQTTRRNSSRANR